MSLNLQIIYFQVIIWMVIKRYVNSPDRNQNMGVDAMDEPCIPSNSGQNYRMEIMKQFKNV